MPRSRTKKTGALKDSRISANPQRSTKTREPHQGSFDRARALVDHFDALGGQGLYEPLQQAFWSGRDLPQGSWARFERWLLKVCRLAVKQQRKEETPT